MEPSPHNPKNDEFILKLTGFDRVGAIKSDTCAICKKEAKVFKDKLSIKEYTITGLCQECQDTLF